MSFNITKLVDPIQFTNVAGGLVPRGAYNAGTDYAVGDSVDYNGSSYVMHTDAGAGTLPTNTTYWQVLANKGDTGATGATGEPGTNGQGVPTGGTTGQQLAKINGTDYNTQWVNPVDISGKVNKTGDTMTGSLELESTNTGGENNFDSTSRLNLESYQRAQKTASDGTTYAHFGEVIRIANKTDNSKAMIAGYADYIAADKPIYWLGGHGKSNDGGSWHNHFSIETPDENGQLQTRFEIPFAPFNSPNAYGIPYSDGYVRAISKLIAGGGYGMYVEGAAGTSRNIHFSSGSYGADTSRRWSLEVNNTAESGSNVGSDFRLNRRSDTGSYLGTSISIKRSNGYVGINQTSASQALDVSGNIAVSGTVDGRDIATDGSKLDGIEAGAQVNTVTPSNSVTLTNKTLTSPVLNTGVSGTAIDTDGTLTANSDTKLASQKAVKTYVDNRKMVSIMIDAGGSTFDTTTTETTVLTGGAASIPAGTLNTNGDVIKFEFTGIEANNTGSAVTFTHRLKVGGNTLTLFNAYSQASNAFGPWYRVVGEVTRTSDTTMQVSAWLVLTSALNTTISQQYINTATWTVSSLASNALSFDYTIQMGTSSATAQIDPRHSMIRVERI